MNNPTMLRELARIKQAELLREAEASRLSKSAETRPLRRSQIQQRLATAAAIIAIVLGLLIFIVR